VQQVHRHVTQLPPRPENQPAEPCVDQQRRVVGRRCALLLQPVTEVEPPAANINSPTALGPSRNTTSEIVVTNDEPFDIGALDPLRVGRQRKREFPIEAGRLDLYVT